MEEAQHAKLDTLMVEELANALPGAEIDAAVEGYLALGAMIDGGLRQQVAFDLDAFTRATGRRLAEAEREALARQQHQAQRWTFIGSGMSHPNFLASVGALSPAQGERLAGLAPQFC